MNCARCGHETAGVWTEGGLRTALCEDCDARERAVARRELEEDRITGAEPQEETMDAIEQIYVGINQLESAAELLGWKRGLKRISGKGNKFESRRSPWIALVPADATSCMATPRIEIIGVDDY